MRLKSLVQKKQLVILGLNSGTSMDGLDMAAVSFYNQRNSLRASLLKGRTGKFDPAIRDRIMQIADSPTVALDEQIQTDNALGMFLGRAARSFVRYLSRHGIHVDAIASHGQTVRHSPRLQKVGPYRVRGTLQLGSLEQISTIVGLPVVGDFRQAAVALKGEGAPITVEAVRQLLSDKKESRLVVNIGGMSNYFYLPKASLRRKVKATDCGPGNVLSDLLSLELYGEQFDRNGHHAANGSISLALLKRLCAEPFFGKPSGSTGREEFGPDLTAKILLYARKNRMTSEDMLATVVELTAQSIERSVRVILKSDKSLAKLYLTGGGSHNKFLVQRLQQQFDSIAVGSVRELGFDPDLLEAASYALIGYRTLAGLSTRDWTRAASERDVQPVLGKIVQPPRKV